MEQKQQTQQRRTVTFGQLIGVIFGIACAFLAFYTQTQVRISNLELRMQEKESKDADFHDQFEKINAKLDGMRLEIFDLKTEIMKKADRKD